MNLPKHLAFIMDGNRRWAKAHHLPLAFGHRQGAKTFEKIFELCVQKGIQNVTFYAFSTENWNRDEEEVQEIFSLMAAFLPNSLKMAKENNIRINFLGDLSKVNPELRLRFEEAARLTKDNQKAVINIAINYGGRDEIIRAVNQCIQETKRVNIDSVTKFLDTVGQPDPDMIVRTGGEKRLSNFLTWQSTYSELYFCDCLWPDFDKEELNKVLNEYEKRSRRFGK